MDTYLYSSSTCIFILGARWFPQKLYTNKQINIFLIIKKEIPLSDVEEMLDAFEGLQ